MKAIAVVAVLCVLSLALAEPLPGLHDKKQNKHPHPHPNSKQNKHPSPLLGSTHKSSHSSTHHSSHSSSASHAPPAVLAKEAISIFGDADGSALFEGKKVLTHTIAEVPPKNKKNSHQSKHSSSHKSSASQKLHELKLKHSKESSKSKQNPFAKLAHTHHSSSSPSGSSSNPRFNRPLFNFKDVPKPADSVVIRKHHFATKHHSLVKKFANKHAKAQLVIVVDAFVSPAGRRSKKLGDKKKRGHKKSDTNLVGLLHKNLFVFDDKGKQLFPKDSHSSSSSRSGSQSKHSNSKLSSNKPAIPGLRPVPGQHGKKDEKKPIGLGGHHH